jgi:hypothetical protein
MIIDKVCAERGCPMHEEGDEYVEMVRREWVGLTDEEIEELAKWADKHAAPWHLGFARAVEAKLKEKNSESS